MHRVAALVETWHRQRRAGVVARVISSAGLGPQGRDEFVVIDADGRTGGAVLGGAVQPELVAATRQLLHGHDTHRVDRFVIDSDNATAAGLTCGGTVELLLQRLDVIPTPLWESVAAGRAVVLATVLNEQSAPVVVHSDGSLDGSLGSTALDAMVQAEADALLERPGTQVARVSFGDVDVAVEAWDPMPRLLIVGASDVSVALQRQAELIGWSASTVIQSDVACARIEHLDHGDAIVVIDHDPFVSTPALASALRHGVGYAGALGSRQTQQRRREHLPDNGVDERLIRRMHGPTGLDLGARNATETAVSIVAEIIAVRPGRRVQPLTGGAGRIQGRTQSA